MAYTAANLVLWSHGNDKKLFRYTSTDNIATISGVGYFKSDNNLRMAVQDLIFVNASDDMAVLRVSAVASGGDVTTVNPAINKLVQGVASGYKVARGGLSLGATKFGIATGLTSIDAVLMSIKSTSAPSNVIKVTYDATGGTLKLYGWKYTSSTTNTLTAASGTASVKWVAVGA